MNGISDRFEPQKNSIRVEKSALRSKEILKIRRNRQQQVCLIVRWEKLLRAQFGLGPLISATFG
jgi:hypothetical protein